MTKPKVLISDALSPAAVQIFRDRGSKRNSRRRLKKSTTIDWSHTTSLARASVESAD